MNPSAAMCCRRNECQWCSKRSKFSATVASSVHARDSASCNNSAGGLSSWQRRSVARAGARSLCFVHERLHAAHIWQGGDPFTRVRSFLQLSLPPGIKVCEVIGHHLLQTATGVENMVRYCCFEWKLVPGARDMQIHADPRRNSPWIGLFLHIARARACGTQVSTSNDESL